MFDVAGDGEAGDPVRCEMSDIRCQMSNAEKQPKRKNGRAARLVAGPGTLIHNFKERAPYVVAVKQNINPVNSVG